jgi:hypothetical protein
MTPALGDTLLALIGALDAPQDAGVSGVVVTELDLTVPLEGTATVENGELVIRANVPHTRWVTGFMPPVHTAHLRIVGGDDG